MLQKVIAAAEKLVREEHFSVENLCLASDCGLRELGEAVGTVDDVISHVNDRFMAAYLEKAAPLAQEPDDLKAVTALAMAWLDHAVSNPQNMEMLLLHRWAPHFTRPDWYLARVNACFAPMEARLAKLGPGAAAAAVAGVARGIYAHICGLYFLSINERAKPAGIESIRGLLQLHVAMLARGLGATTA
jgi:AcrR family transcriptional regulator